jgi:hypothetical protein
VAAAGPTMGQASTRMNSKVKGLVVDAALELGPVMTIAHRCRLHVKRVAIACVVLKRKKINTMNHL